MRIYRFSLRNRVSTPDGPGVIVELTYKTLNGKAGRSMYRVRLEDERLRHYPGTKIALLES